MGMRVAPPTSTTSSICDGSSFASDSARSKGSRQRLTNSSVSCSNLLRVSFICRCLGPLASAVMKGRLISVSSIELSSTLAFSAASLSRCNAWRSWRRSIPCSLRNCSPIQSTTAWSQSSPPRWVSPLVDLTSTTPSPTSSTLTSKVPPPRSHTRTVSLSFLSRP